MGIVILDGVVINNAGTTAGNIPVQTSSTSVVTSGLQLYYDASNVSSYPGSGSTVYDLSGNFRSSSLTAASMYTSSVAGGTFYFDGVNQIISSSYLPNNICTFQMAINNTYSYLTDWNRGILSTYGGLDRPNQTYGIYIGTNNNYPAYTNGMHMYTDGNTQTPLGTTSTWTINTWYIVTAVSNGSNVSVYLNGNTTPIASVNNTTTHTRPLRIGLSGYDANYWRGYIANTLVYNRALNTTEITQNYNALKGRFGLS